MAGAKEYEGKQLSVRFDARRCIHAAECVHGLPGVFDPERRPWIDPDAGDPSAIVEVVESCPSGALTYERHDGGPAEVPASDPAVRVSANGPLYIRGAIELVGYDGNVVADGARAALCRCGASKNKPFCDNSHTKIDFKPDEETT